MPKDPLSTPFVVSRQRRDATVVIRGYVYQVNTTLLKWIELEPDQWLELEAGEDIDTLQQAVSNPNLADRILEGIKCRERNLTLRSQEGLSALATFHEHRQSNPSLRLAFRYITNSSVGAEKPAVTEAETPGIHLWERVRGGLVTGKPKSRIISALRTFLKGSVRPAELTSETWDSFQRFLKRCTIPELNRFIDAFEWGTEQPAPDDLEGKVRHALITSGKTKTIEDAQAAFQHLFHFVFALLSKRSGKILTPQLLDEELRKLDGVETGRNILSTLSGIEASLQARFDRLEEQIAPLQSDMHEVKATLERIKGAVISLEQPVGDSADLSDRRSPDLPTAPQVVISGNFGYEMSTPLPSIVASALIAQNEELAAVVVAQAAGQTTAIRDAVRKGLRSQALRDIAAQRENRVVWQVLPAERKAELLRIEAIILLNSEDGINKAKQLLAEAASLAPAEADSRLRASIAFSEHDPQTAISLLEGKQQPESRNLLALFHFLTGRYDDGRKALPTLDSDPAIRAETLRVRALGRLHNGNLSGAREDIDLALAAKPDWPVLRLVSGSISYYEALSPAAIPSRLQEWPEPSSSAFKLNTSEAKAKLRDAATIFAQLAEWLESSVEERQLSQVWHFACLATDASRREEARIYAANVLANDPGQYRLVPWVLAQRYEALDLTATEKSLTTACSSGQANVFHVIALVMLLIRGSNAAEALATLDQAHQLFLPLNSNAWHHWRAIALLTAGNVAAAKVELDQFDGAQRLDPLWSEIQRFESRESGDWDAYETALKTRFDSTNSVDALLEYCDFAARRRNWNAVAPFSAELVKRIGTPEALCLAAIANLNSGKAGHCLELLESHTEFWYDEFRGDELRRISIACNRKLGNLMAARKQAEQLLNAAETTENLLLLAQLQLDTGDSKTLALSARKLAQRQDLSSDQALRIAMFVRQDDPQLARSLWRRAIANALPDEAVGAAVRLGYHLGLDRELRPLLARMNVLGQQGKGGIERKTLQDLIELIKNHQENVGWFSGLYNKGEMAIHLIPARIRGELVGLYHDGPSYREENPEQAATSLLAIHGGRPWTHGFPSEVPTWRLNIDITSLLLAQHLGILPKVESAFGVLRIVPSIFSALRSMQDSLQTAQVSQIDAAREVLACVDSGLLSVLESNESSPPSDLAAYGGTGWAALYEVSRQTGGRVVDFVPKITINPAAVVPSDAAARLVNSRTVIEALRQLGAISADEFSLSLSDLGTEGQEPPAGSPIEGHTDLYCQSTMAKLLADVRLLRPACRIFRLHMLRDDANELNAAIRHHERSKELSEWLSALSQYIRQKIEERRYEFMPIGLGSVEASQKWDDTFDVKYLYELLTFAAEPGDTIWIDDRYVNAYQRRDTAPIVSIVDILKALVAAKELTPSEYYRLLNRLRAAKCSFIPFEAGEILHHLMQAPVTSSDFSYALSETPEMGVIRRYWAENLLRSNHLQRPGTSTANAGGEIAFLLSSVNAVRDAIAGLWETNLTQTTEEREARAGWLLDTMYIDYVGVRALAELPSGETKDHELMGVSLGSLVATGLQMRIERRCTTRALRNYLYWLYHRILHRAFEGDDRVLQSAAAFIRAALRTLWQVAEEEQKPYARSLIRLLLELLPDELQKGVQTEAEFAAELGIELVSIVQVGPLRFQKRDYLEAAREAMNGRRGRAIIWRSKDEIEFEPKVDGITLKPPTGESMNVADSLLALLSDDASQRERAIMSHSEWFDCDPGERTKAMELILAQEDPLARVEVAEGWREQSAAVFYANLSRKLAEQEGFVPDDIRPPSAERLLRYYRLPRDPSRGSFLEQIASGSEQIIEEFGIAQSFVRFAGLPIPLPEALLRRVNTLSDSQKRALVKSLLRTAGSPLSAIHLVRLLADMSEVPGSSYWRVATRVIGALLKPDAVKEFSAFKGLLQWMDSAFGTWPQTKAWSSTERLAMVWAHTHRVFSTFTYLGVSAEWIADRFRRTDFGLSHQLFDQQHEGSEDIAHPTRVSREVFLLAGLTYAAGEKAADWWDDSIRLPLLDLVHPVENGGTLLNVGLLRDASLASDLLGSFLARDCSHIPCSVLKDDAADSLLRANMKKSGAEALQAAQAGNSIPAWTAIAWMFGELPVDDDQRKIMESAILNIDLVPLTNDLDACEILLHAASMQASALRNSSVTAHLSEQMARFAGLLGERSGGTQKMTDAERRFAASLFQVAINLSRSAPNGTERVSEFARLFARIADAFPKSAVVCRHLLSRMWPCQAEQAKLLWRPVIRSRAVEG